MPKPVVSPWQRRRLFVLAPSRPMAALQGKHRVLYLLYKQRITMRPPAKRQGFQVRSFEKEHGLGAPAAGLFVWVTNPEE